MDEELKAYLDKFDEKIKQSLSVSELMLISNKVQSGIDATLKNNDHIFNPKKLEIDFHKEHVFNFIYDETPGSIDFILGKSEHKSIRIEASNEFHAREKFNDQFKHRVVIIDVKDFGETRDKSRLYATYYYQPSIPLTTIPITIKVV
ncbi:hypothetical protein N9948_02210 [bacterium]|nr:hypothetical protein [bacterium]